MKKSLFKKLGIALVFVLIFSLMTSTAVFAETPTDGWNASKTKYYEDGVEVSGFKTIDNYRFYFNPTNHVKVTGPRKIKNDYYYFSKSGVMQFGWKTIDGKRYYYKAPSGKAVKGLKKIGKSYYYFNNSIVMRKGWQKINGDMYRFNTKTGRAETGLRKIGKSYYAFYTTGKRKTGWQNINGYRYYFNPKSGRSAVGLRKINGGYYFFGSTSKMNTGWKTVNGYKYYFNPAKGSGYGKAVTGTKKINGTTYRFNSKGQLITPEMKMTTRAQKYTSETKYLILVNKSTHRVGIFKRNKDNNWVMSKYWLCTIGASGTPTPSGTFRMGHGGTAFHQLYFDSGAIRCWYASNFYGGYHFHSVLYVPASGPYRIAYGQLGANLSHGCIRLKLENAKWIYNNIPKGTKVVIYS